MELSNVEEHEGLLKEQGVQDGFEDRSFDLDATNDEKSTRSRSSSSSSGTLEIYINSEFTDTNTSDSCDMLFVKDDWRSKRTMTLNLAFIGLTTLFLVFLSTRISHLLLLWNTPSPAWVLSAPASELPVCDKIFVHTLGHSWGFGSQWNFYMRVAALAERHGFTFLEDDSKWNYGRLNNYFQPRKIYCNPRWDWYKPPPGETRLVGEEGWEHAKVVTTDSHVTAHVAVDDWEYEHFLSEKQSEIRSLYLENKAFHFNHSRDIIPMRQQEIQLEKRLAGFLPDHPTIGLYIRLGDKGKEWSSDEHLLGVTNTFGNLTTYLVAAQEAHQRLLKTTDTPLTSTATLYDPEARPRLLVMTAEDGVMETLQKDSLASGFDIIRTSPTKAPHGQIAHHLQKDFNSWPIEMRVAEGKALVRDLTLLARDADALIVSGLSNVGRMAMVWVIRGINPQEAVLILINSGFDRIPGPEAATGPVDGKTGEFTGGRIRSVDTPWYPLSTWHLLLDRVADPDAAGSRRPGKRGNSEPNPGQLRRRRVGIAGELPQT